MLSLAAAGVEAVAEIEVILSPVTTMVWASRSLPEWTSSRCPAWMRVRAGVCARAGERLRAARAMLTDRLRQMDGLNRRRDPLFWKVQWNVQSVAREGRPGHNSMRLSQRVTR
jgi:hypothetical protein